MTSPPRIPPWIAAPTATTSSGLTPLLPSLPKISFTMACTAGIRVDPPTRITWSMSAGDRLASRMACTHGPRVLSNRSPARASSFARVREYERWRGPAWSAVMKGRFTEVALGAGQLDLGLLRRFLQPLQGHAVPGEVDARLAAELARHPVDEPLVDVVSPEVRVAVGGLHLEDAVAELEDGDVEGPAAQVVDGDGLLAAVLVQAVGERGGGGLVHDALHLQPRDAARVLRRLALGVVEVGGNRDHGLGDRLAEVVLGRLLHLLQDGGGDLRRRELLRRGCSPARRCPRPPRRRAPGGSPPAPPRPGGP